MAEPTLLELYLSHQGKVSDKWHGYLREYDRLLSAYRHKPISLLEIGVQNGGSLEIWAKYFDRATAITGCDINEECAKLSFEDPRISLVIGDVTRQKTEQQLLDSSPEFDVVIDDGSHESGDIVNSFTRYFPHVCHDGLYIVEDLHCSYWEEFGGGLYHPHSSVAFFKNLADLINRQFWGVDISQADFLTDFKSLHNLEIPEDVLSTIHTVEFTNSMCVIRKAPVDENTLGKRIIAGKVEEIVKGHHDLPDLHHVDLEPQDGNFWSNRPCSPLRELPARLIEITNLESVNSKQQETIEQLSEAVDELENRITELGQKLELAEQGRDEARRELDQRNEQFKAASELLKKRDGQMVNLESYAKARDALLSHIQTSPGWAISRPIRALWRRIHFNDRFYLKQNPDVAEAEVDPYEHYITHGRLEGRLAKPSGWFERMHGMHKSFRTALEIEGGVAGALKTTLSILRNEGLQPVKEKLKTIVSNPELNDYAQWIEKYDVIDEKERVRIRERILCLLEKPLISVLMPTYNAQIEWLREAVESVRAQIYENWELCIADDASTDKVVREYLLSISEEDSRIKVVFRDENGHISAASNSALKLASGDWVALLDHDDVLPEHALSSVVEVINRRPAAKLIYSDEDKINDNGLRFDPYFKPDWNLDLFYSQNMISHLGVYRRDILDEIGGFREGMEGSQDYDLALRYIEGISQKDICHIPRVLYHWRTHQESTAKNVNAKPYAAIAAAKALQEHLNRKKIAARVERLSFCHRVHYQLPRTPPLVTLIIPTRNGLNLLRMCIESILAKTKYPNFEILIVDNGSDDPDTLDYLSSLEKNEKIRTVRDDGPFNFSRLNNAAAGIARGELVGFINNDIEVISPGWLNEMVSIAIQPGVGSVGAKLLYPDDTVQHAGVVLGIGGVGNHSFKGQSRNDPGYFGRARLISAYSALTAACMLTHKELFQRLGGFEEKHLAIAFNDVDYCIRVRNAGYRNVWSPFALLYHHESATRGSEDSPAKQARFVSEIKFMQKRWGQELLFDPAYNPNLTLEREDFSLAWPPRTRADQ